MVTCHVNVISIRPRVPDISRAELVNVKKGITSKSKEVAEKNSTRCICKFKREVSMYISQGAPVIQRWIWTPFRISDWLADLELT